MPVMDARSESATSAQSLALGRVARMVLWTSWVRPQMPWWFASAWSFWMATPVAIATTATSAARGRTILWMGFMFRVLP